MKRAHLNCKLNLPTYSQKYKTGHWELLQLKLRKGFALDYEYGWYAVDFSFLFLKMFFEWRVPRKGEEEK